MEHHFSYIYPLQQTKNERNGFADIFGVTRNHFFLLKENKLIFELFFVSMMISQHNSTSDVTELETFLRALVNLTMYNLPSLREFTDIEPSDYLSVGYEKLNDKSFDKNLFFID